MGRSTRDCQSSVVMQCVLYFDPTFNTDMVTSWHSVNLLFLRCLANEAEPVPCSKKVKSNPYKSRHTYCSVGWGNTATSESTLRYRESRISPQLLRSLISRKASAGLEGSEGVVLELELLSLQLDRELDVLRNNPLFSNTVFNSDAGSSGASSSMASFIPAYTCMHHMLLLTLFCTSHSMQVPGCAIKLVSYIFLPNHNTI